MDKIKLAASAREEKTPNQLRREGKVPATLYGPGQPSVSVQVDAREFGRLPVAAYSHMLELSLDGKPVSAVIRNVQRKATTSEILNVELYIVAMDRLLTLSVPLHFIGSSPAVVLGGQLIEGFQEAELESLPGNLPDFIEVDLGMLKVIDDSIHFSDLKVPNGVRILNPMDEVVARVVTPRATSEADTKTAPTATEATPAAAAASA